MSFTQSKKNIFLDTTNNCISELGRIKDKITARRDQFIANEGDISGTVETDLTNMSDSELMLKQNVLNKLRCEIDNVQSQLLFELKKIDREIMKRNE